jgi:hypothetical protein
VLYGYRDINYAGVTTGKQLHHHGIRGREEVKKIEHNFRFKREEIHSTRFG